MHLENFNHGNKSERKKIKIKKSTVYSIKDSTENVTHDPQQINKYFKKFYKPLYMPQISIWCCHWIFFNYINLPKLNDEQIVVLDSSLSMSEFHKALQRLPTKGSGPKGDQAVLQRSLSYISTSFFQNGHTLIMYSAFICKWNWAVAEWKSWSFAWLKKWANDDR